MAPDLLVCTRYGIGIKDPRWFRHRERLISAITAPSLLAQTDRNFTWVVFIDADMPADARTELERIVAPFGNRVVLYTQGRYTNKTFVSLALELGLERGGYILTGRIDDDDAWETRAVEMVRESAARWMQSTQPKTDVLGITFDLGLEWIMYDIYDIDARANTGRDIVRKAAVREFPRVFHGDSVYVLAKPELEISCIVRNHGKIHEYLTSAPYDIDIISAGRPMWLYTRHKQVSTGLQHGATPSLGLTVGDLSRSFGLDRDRVAAYLAEADQFGYLVEKRTEHRRNLVAQRLREIQAQQAAGQAEPEIEEERKRLAEEYERLCRDVIGEAPAIPA